MKMWNMTSIGVVLALAAMIVPAGVWTVADEVPGIHCTDLFHPPGDPDDHFDLATLSSRPEVDLRAVILDYGPRQETHPGSIPLSQRNALTKRQVPWAIGLSRKLSCPDDKLDSLARSLFLTSESTPSGVEALSTLRLRPDCVGTPLRVHSAAMEEDAFCGGIMLLDQASSIWSLRE